jgi:hypothetical protein
VYSKSQYPLLLFLFYSRQSLFPAFREFVVVLNYSKGISMMAVLSRDVIS